VVTSENVDEWNMSYLRKLVMGWGYELNSFRIWSRFDGYVDDFFELKRDDDAYEVAVYACGSEVEGQVFVEHNVSHEGSESDSDSEGVNFSDSEDERVVGLDDGFVETGMDDKVYEQNMKVVADTIGCSEYKFEDGECVSDGYESAELGSSDPDASDDEKGPKYEKYRKAHMSEHFKFKYGMEFNSLPEFREAIREWSALKGCPVDFVKNEGTRVRVVCERKCGFKMLCSRVG
jgi:hypothetical protein